MKLFIICLSALFLCGCAAQVSFEQAASIKPVGFWYGLWHGVILPFSFLGTLFSDKISIYAIYNNGGWYDFGFFLGVGVCCGSRLKTKKK